MPRTTTPRSRGLHVYGTPGGYATHLKRHHRTKQTLYLLTTAILAGAALWFTPHGLLLYLTLAVIAGTILAARHHHQRASRARIGAQAEQHTLNELRKGNFQGDAFLGLTIGGGGDVDIILVDTDNRVYVGEIKTVYGHVTTNGTTIYSNGKPLATQPVPQVKRQVEALRRKGIPAFPFVVVSHGKLHRTQLTCDGIPVVNAATLTTQLGHWRAPQSSTATRTLQHIHKGRTT